MLAVIPEPGPKRQRVSLVDSFWEIDEKTPVERFIQLDARENMTGWWWLEPWNLIRLSIYWESWSQLTFICFRGVGLPPTRDCGHFGHWTIGFIVWEPDLSQDLRGFLSHGTSIAGCFIFWKIPRMDDLRVRPYMKYASAEGLGIICHWKKASWSMFKACRIAVGVASHWLSSWLSQSLYLNNYIYIYIASITRV